VEWRDAVIYLRWLKVLGEVCFCLDAGFAVACGLMYRLWF